jgi:hypothetical protein
MRMLRGDDSSVWVMSRDEQMLEWFSIVRVSNVETIRRELDAQPLDRQALKRGAIRS